MKSGSSKYRILYHKSCFIKVYMSKASFDHNKVKSNVNDCALSKHTQNLSSLKALFFKAFIPFNRNSKYRKFMNTELTRTTEQSVVFQKNLRMKHYLTKNILNTMRRMKIVLWQTLEVKFMEESRNAPTSVYIRFNFIRL